jgi:heme-degrading monooxygenase HmoA
MYVVTNRIPIANDFTEAFEKRFRNRAGKIDKQPGFVRMDVMRPLDESGVYLVMTVWESEHAFKNWVISEDFEQAHQNPMPKEAYSGETRMERHEIAITALK